MDCDYMICFYQKIAKHRLKKNVKTKKVNGKKLFIGKNI